MGTCTVAEGWGRVATAAAEAAARAAAAAARVVRAVVKAAQVVRAAREGGMAAQGPEVEKVGRAGCP
jgi:hypothetical protein